MAGLRGRGGPRRGARAAVGGGARRGRGRRRGRRGGGRGGRGGRGRGRRGGGGAGDPRRGATGGDRLERLGGRRAGLRLGGGRAERQHRPGQLVDLVDRVVEAAGGQAVDELLARRRSEEHTSELQSRGHLVCRLLLEKKKKRVRQNSSDLSL